MPDTGPSHHKRALLFRLPGDESATNALNLAKCADLAGIGITMVPYWPDGQPSWGKEVFLLEQDIGSAPRLSEFALKERHGVCLDLLDLQAHSFATEVASPDLLLPESIWQQKLRGVAAHVCDLIDREKPDLVFIAHGAEIISRIVTEVAAFKSIKAMFWESGFFPDHLYLDTHAPHFFRGLSSLEVDADLHEANEATIEFIDRWKSIRNSKYLQSSQDLACFSAWKSEDKRPILFVAGQVPTDANAVVGLGNHASLQDLYRETLKLPDNWRMLFKPHPKAPASQDYLSNLDAQNVFYGDIPVIDAIESSDAVLVHSSNVGLEALLLGKPTIVTGQPIYATSGQTFAVKNSEQLARLLTEPLPVPQRRTIEGFTQSLLDKCLIDFSDSSSLRKRVQAAQIPQQQRSLLGYYSEPVQTLIGAARELHNALQVRPLLNDALNQITLESRQTLTAACDATILSDHIHAGPIAPSSTQCSHPVSRPVKGKHTTLPARLEECPFPEEYLRSQMTETNATYAIGCLLADGAEETAAQAFCAADLQSIALRLDRDLEIVLHSKAKFMPATLVFHPKSQSVTQYVYDGFEDWHVPLQAFSMPENIATDTRAEVILDGTHVHAVYGPYMHIPTGVWTVDWSNPSTPCLEWLKSRLFRSHWKKLSFEIIEKVDGAERVVLSAPYAKFKASFVAREDATYELRPHWRGKPERPSIRQPRFNGLWLRWMGTPA